MASNQLRLEQRKHAFSWYTNKNYDVQIFISTFSSWLRWDDDELEIDLW